MAVSLVGKQLQHYDTAAHYACKIVKKLIEQPIAQDQILNVNVPDLPLSEIRGVQITRLGARHRAEGMVRTTDPAGKEIFWLGPR